MIISARENYSRLFYYVALFVIAVLAAYLSYTIKIGHLAWPASYSTSDDIQVLLQAHNAAQTGGLFSYPHLGAPFHFNAEDFPLYEPLNFFIIFLFSVFSKDPLKLVLAYHLFSLGLSAVTAAILIRALGGNRWIAFAGGFAYALSPIVQGMKAVAHMMLASVYMLPLCLLAALWVNHDRAPHKLGVKWFAVALFALGFTTELQNVYYAFFGLLIMAVAALSGAIHARRWRPVLMTGAFTLGVVLSLGLTQADRLITMQQTGINETHIARGPTDTQFFGTQMSYLLMPHEFYRLRLLQNTKMYFATHLSDNFKHNDITTHSIGLFATIGFLFLLVLPFLQRPIMAKFPQPPQSDDQLPLPATLLFLSSYLYAALLYTMPGGFDNFVNATILPIFHVPNRIVILIGLISITGGSLLATMMIANGRRHRRAPRPLAWTLGLLGVALVAIYFEQTTNYAKPNYFYPDNLTAVERYQADDVFFKELEQILPAGAGVYQYPFSVWSGLVPWGETSGRPAIHTERLLWDYGGFYNRQFWHWNIALAEQPIDEQLRELEAKGFAAVEVDPLILPDALEFDHYSFKPDELIAALKRISARPPMISSDGQHQVYFLPGWQQAKLQRDCEPYQPGTLVEMTPKGRGERYLDIGWDNAGLDGARMSKAISNRSDINLCFVEPAAAGKELTIAFDLINDLDDGLQLTLKADGQTVSNWNLTRNNDIQHLTATLPANMIDKNGLLRLSFTYGPSAGAKLVRFSVE